MNEKKPNPDDRTPKSPFNLEALRAPQNFQQTGGVQKTTLSVLASSRPPKNKFLRVHPFDDTHGQEKWCANVLVFSHQFEDDIGPENFIVPSTAEPYEALLDKLALVLIVCGMTRLGAKFLWELKLPTAGNNRRANHWHETRLTCARKATEAWVRPEADMHGGGYNFCVPLAQIEEPDWGQDSFPTLFEIAYRDRIIDSLEHPVCKEYLGG